MSIIYVNEYQKELAELYEAGGSRNESALRPAFQNCVAKYCRQHGRTLVTELSFSTSAIPDGTIKDSLRLSWGYWEAKDSKDDLDKEIEKKIARGYPMSNIIYEDTNTAVLIQEGAEVARVDMRKSEELDKFIRQFFAYEPPAIASFRKAVEQFKQDLPNVVKRLRRMIDDSYAQKKQFTVAADDFLDLCRGTINPEIVKADVGEMLIQHILTKDIFLKVFDEDQFHKENNIAVQLSSLEETFFTGNTRRAIVDKLKSYYSAITATAAEIANYQEKQKFLKSIYEDFYKTYNPKAADRLGVVYTPNEIVRFMIRATDELVRKHFGRHVYDNNVQILDPATGTGTFITDLIDFIPAAHLKHKYDNELHANEVAILPYYIANLNIEYTYKQKTGEYREFPNICLVDTLDNVSFTGGPRGRQQTLIGGMSSENLARVVRQNEKKISVIIGNPPYNANQRSETDNNPNRKYPEIDNRIKGTYVANSRAKKTQQYDMYKRFIRWASDRLHDNGVLAFITNRAYLDARQDDGFRKVVLDEFNEIYIVDLGGDIRTTRGAQNVFGIMTGVAIGFFVRNENKTACDVFYKKPNEFMPAQEKLAYLTNTRFAEVDFERIIPDAKSRWLEQTDTDFGKLINVADDATKFAKAPENERAIFKLASSGVQTNRDIWVHDFDKQHLAQKVKFFIETYEEMRRKLDGGKFDGDTLGNEIKWTRSLKNQLRQNKANQFNAKNTRHLLYRPFVKNHIYFDSRLNEVQYQTPRIFPAGVMGENRVIYISQSARIPFCCLATACVPANALFVETGQCLPLYRYDKDGNRISNITEWGLKQFRDHYGEPKITAVDIFHYTYAVLHNPAYLEKYATDLQQQFPRLPFYADFRQWVKWGERLMTLHCDYETQTAHPLARIDNENESGKVKLTADKPAGVITLDEQTNLAGIPPEAWQYRLGRRSALEWVLDQYKEKTIKDPTVAAKFNTYRFADHKEAVIKLLGKVCTVSIETIKIIKEMEQAAE